MSRNRTGTRRFSSRAEIEYRRCDGLLPSSQPSLTRTQVIIHETPDSKFASDVKHFPLLPPFTKQKPNINGAFLRQLRAIVLRIAMPSLRSKEALIIFMHSFFLLMRTYLSVLVAKLDGAIVRDLVSPPPRLSVLRSDRASDTWRWEGVFKGSRPVVPPRGA